MRECLETFRGCAASSLNRAYGFARAPECAIRGILDAAIGMHDLFNKALVYRGYALKDKPGRHCDLRVGMQKRTCKHGEGCAKKLRQEKAQTKMETEGKFPLSTTSFWCKLASTPKGLRGRSHLRCLVHGCLFATDRESMMSNRGRAHNCDGDGV